MRNLSVIIPCFNEENTILDIIALVLEQVNVGQVVIVNDCSTDRTTELLKTLTDLRCVVLDQEINRLTNDIKAAKDQAIAVENQQISPLKMHRKFLNEVSHAFEQLYERKSTRIV
jgi:glycosyltransferase involved in cell wall biosynthesis